MLVVLSLSSLLVASALADTEGQCANITVKSDCNCPRKGYECDEALPIKYTAINDNWAQAEVKCVDKYAKLAVNGKIVDKVACDNQTWRAQGSCSANVNTTSVVCAKNCGASACSCSSVSADYDRLWVHESTESSKCAFAKCKYGFVVLHHNGTLIKELPASTCVKCSGNGKWKVSDCEWHRHVMCKKGPKTCDYDCHSKPWDYAYLHADSAAIKDGCDYSCPAGAVLTRKDGRFARTMTFATCTRRGFLNDNGDLAHRIGCSTCDVADGPIGTNVPLSVPANSTNCILACPTGFALRYGKNGDYKFAPDNVLHRQFHPETNNWITTGGFVLTRYYNVNCVRSA